MSIIVVSGPPGCGKTTLCRRVVSAARARGLSVGGVLSPARLAGGVKVGIDVLDVRSDDSRPLAEDAQASGPATMQWRFHPGALKWGMGVLRRSVPCDLFIIDELGPLELVRGTGWVEALPLLRSGGYRWALVVVRPTLVPRFLELVPAAQPPVVLAGRDDQDRLLARITAQWGEHDAQR